MLLRPKLLLLMVFISIALLSCGNSKETQTNMEPGPTSIDNVSPIIDIAAMTELADRDDVLLVDNRPREKFMKGHLKDAVNFPYFARNAAGNEMTLKKLVAASKEKSTIVFYCTGHMRAKKCP